jgi:putative aldouronate transport system substrate-binding protein
LTRQHTTPKTEIEVYFPRENTGNRIRNLLRGMEMWGLRGVFSRHQWLYFDEEGLIQDVRHEQRFVDAINDLSDLYADGMIVQDPEDGGNWRSLLLNTSSGFMTYDYNASSTSASFFTAGRVLDPDMSFQAVLPPVVDWLDNGEYFHFTEAARSVKNEAWGIPKHVEGNEAKLNRALMLVDQLYDYSAADSVGTMHLYGPAGWTDGTLTYGSDVVYKLSDEALAEMNDANIGGGNMINYLRLYVGATLPIGHIRSLGLEFQTLSDEGQEGVGRINTAVSAGVLKLAGQVDSDNPWFDLSPTFYPLTKYQSDMITAAATFQSNFTDANLITLVKYGFSGLGGSLTEEAYWEEFMFGTVDAYEIYYIGAYRDAYSRIGD